MFCKPFSVALKLSPMNNATTLRQQPVKELGGPAPLSVKHILNTPKGRVPCFPAQNVHVFHFTLPSHDLRMLGLGNNVKGTHTKKCIPTNITDTAVRSEVEEEEAGKKKKRTMFIRFQ